MKMQAPNMKSIVEQVCKEYPEAFDVELAKKKYPNHNPPKWDLDVTRRLIMPIIAKRCDLKSGKKIWALLYRNDRQDSDPRPGRLTSDVLVHIPSLEHIDVLSGSGAMWENHGPITDKDWDIEDPDKHISFEDLKGDVVDEPDESDDAGIDAIAEIKRLKDNIVILETSLKAANTEILELKKPKPVIVSYNDFVGKEALDVRTTFNTKRNHDPSCHDYYHNAYRRLVEGWPHDKILTDI